MIEDCQVGAGYVRRLSLTLRGCNKSLKEISLSLSNTDLLGGEIFQLLRPFFENNHSIDKLLVNGCIFGAGSARQLSLALGRCNKSLRTIWLDRNQMGEEQLVEIIEALSAHPQLEEVELPRMNIGRNGCTALANLLRSTATELRHFDLSGNGIDDNGALVFANALASNRKLKTLDLSSNTGITAEGYSSFSNVLCDTSSINATFLSNHTLESLGGAPSLPFDIRCSLALNLSSEDKKQVAIKKILKQHQRFDMQPFFEWDLKVLPLAVAWFERARSIENNEEAGIIDKCKLDAIYQFIRAMPEVFELSVEQAKVYLW